VRSGAGQAGVALVVVPESWAAWGLPAILPLHANIQILANDFLEEHAPRLWPMQDLGQGKLGLED
jgi:hypothetical protein